MILIADSGSTKTDWRLLINKEKSLNIRTLGFNPYFNSSEYIKHELELHLIPEIYKLIDRRTFLLDSTVKLYYYGAGCSSPEKIEIVRKALRSLFQQAQIEVNHDLLGAARSICGGEEGIAAILGTGSNSCLYNGETVVDHIPSLGYILGDEGSGSHIGKALLRSIMHRDAPAIIKDKFFHEYSITEKDLLTKIYNEPLANKYLASFSEFVLANIDEPYLKDMVYTCFDDFFKAHITKYKNFASKKFNCVGSVGFHYKDILTEVATSYKMEIGSVISAPMDGLAEFHRAEL